MATRVALRHVTRYLYDRPVQLSPQLVRLRPAPHCRTPIVAYSLKVTPERALRQLAAGSVRQLPGALRLLRAGPGAARGGGPGRRSGRDQPVRLLPRRDGGEVPVRLRRGARPRPVALPRAGADRRPLRAARRAHPRRHRPPRPAHARRAGRHQPAVAARPALRHPHGAGRVHARRDARARPRIVPRLRLAVGATCCATSASRRASSPAIRSSSCPIRSRSKAPAGVAQDCTDLHAWAEAYLPGAGWVGFDATSGMACGEGHIPLACTADPSAAAPVLRLVQLGQARRGRPAGRGVRLRDAGDAHRGPAAPDAVVLGGAMGGDPRLRRDRRSRARGRRRAPHHGRRAHLRLRRRHGGRRVEHRRARPAKGAPVGPAHPPAHGAVRPGRPLHHGQGKWYPGESLPRWAYSLYWRKDGEPLWNDWTLLADGSPRRDGSDQARALLQSIVGRLGIADGHVLPGYEDALVLPVARAPAAGQRRCRSTPVSTTKRSARGCVACSRTAWDARSAGRCRCAPTSPAPGCTGAAAPGFCATIASTSPPATRRWAFACRSTRCPGRRPRISWPSTSAIRSPRARRWPRVARWPRRIAAARHWPRPAPPTSPAASRRATSCAPPCASSRATARSTCSCRRWRRSRTTSSSWPRSRPAPPSCACRCASRATRRRTIRACAACRSRPIPASSR